MDEKLIHLRIKIKSLEAESKMIRQEARKTSGLIKQGLNLHRTMKVRPVLREALLAYGFLKGLTYEEMEKKCDLPPNFNNVWKIVNRFTDALNFTAVYEKFELWRKIAQAYNELNSLQIKQFKVS